ncbi:MAG: hypothetical protein J5819_07665 [Eubacterium sp.]|nr:hypothetical protein [Eubacterium sp.]
MASRRNSAKKIDLDLPVFARNMAVLSRTDRLHMDRMVHTCFLSEAFAARIRDRYLDTSVYDEYLPHLVFLDPDHPEQGITTSETVINNQYQTVLMPIRERQIQREIIEKREIINGLRTQLAEVREQLRVVENRGPVQNMVFSANSSDRGSDGDLISSSGGVSGSGLDGDLGVSPDRETAGVDADRLDRGSGDASIRGTVGAVAGSSGSGSEGMKESLRILINRLVGEIALRELEFDSYVKNERYHFRERINHFERDRRENLWFEREHLMLLRDEVTERARVLEKILSSGTNSAQGASDTGEGVNAYDNEDSGEFIDWSGMSVYEMTRQLIYLDEPDPADSIHDSISSSSNTNKDSSISYNNNDSKNSSRNNSKNNDNENRDSFSIRLKKEQLNNIITAIDKREIALEQQEKMLNNSDAIDGGMFQGESADLPARLRDVISTERRELGVIRTKLIHAETVSNVVDVDSKADISRNTATQDDEETFVLINIPTADRKNFEQLESSREMVFREFKTRLAQAQNNEETEQARVPEEILSPGAAETQGTIGANADDNADLGEFVDWSGMSVYEMTRQLIYLDESDSAGSINNSISSSSNINNNKNGNKNSNKNSNSVSIRLKKEQLNNIITAIDSRTRILEQQEKMLDNSSVIDGVIFQGEAADLPVRLRNVISTERRELIEYRTKLIHAETADEVDVDSKTDINRNTATQENEETFVLINIPAEARKHFERLESNREMVFREVRTRLVEVQNRLVHREQMLSSGVRSGTETYENNMVYRQPAETITETSETNMVYHQSTENYEGTGPDGSGHSVRELADSVEMIREYIEEEQDRADEDRERIEELTDVVREQQDTIEKMKKSELEQAADEEIMRYDRERAEKIRDIFDYDNRLEQTRRGMR